MPAAAAPGVGGSQRGYSLPKAPAPNPSVAQQTYAPPPRSQRMYVGKLPQLISHPSGTSVRITPAPKQSAPKRTPLHIGTALGGHDTAGLDVAAISHPGTSMTKLLAAPAGVLGNLGSDIINFVPNAVKGGVQIIGGLGHDLGHPLQSVEHPLHTDTFKLLSAGVKSDPIVQAITHGSLKPLEQHPGYALLDLAGGYGAVGKGLGAAARAGVLGDRAAQAAALTSHADEIAPGIAGTRQVVHGSPNLLTVAAKSVLPPGVKAVGENLRAVPNAIQEYINGLPGGERATRRSGLVPKSTEAQLRKQAALFFGPEKARAAREFTDTAKALRDAKPKGKEEAAVAPYIAAFGGGRDTLESLHQQITTARDLENPRPTTRKLMDKHIANLEAALKKPDLNWDSIHKAAAAYHELQIPLERLKTELNMYEEPELEHALAKQYALQSIPGAEFIPKTKATLDPEWVLRARQAAADVTQARREVREAELNHVKLMNRHGDAEKAVSDAEKQLAKAREQEARSRGYVEGRFGHGGLNGIEGMPQGNWRFRSVDVPPANLTKGVSERLGQRIDTTDQALANRASLRDELKAARSERKQLGLDTIAAKRDQLKDAMDTLRAIRSTKSGNRLSGLVVHDENALPIMQGTYKGRQLRRLTLDEVKQHMASSPHVSYVRMTNPERQRPLTLGELTAERPAGGGTTGTYTGEAARVGDWVPGWNSLLHSQLGDVFATNTRRMERNFVDRFGMRNANGEHFTPHNWEEAAANYENEHGIRLVPMQDRAAGTDKVVLVPKAAQDELRQQLRMERPKGLAKAQMRINRAFSHTVLPMSPKLPVMHTAENVIRAGSAAHGNPFKVIAGHRLATHTLSEMAPEEAARLRELATPGGIGGHQVRLNAEDLGRSALEGNRPAVLRAAGKLAGYYDHAAVGIIRAQRWLERHAQTAALGMHMQHTLQEMGHSWADANTALSRYSHELAQGYHDPALAEDAARYVHRTMGQYNNFTARQRWVITRLAPFAPWYINAARLLLQVLPKDHPLAAALVQDIHNATAKQWDALHTGLPSDLQSALPVGPGAWEDVGKFTPFGLEKNPISEAGSILLPQYMGSIHALFGQDPFGNEFKGPNTPYGKSEISAGIFGDHPAAALEHAGEQMLEGIGGPSYQLARILGGQGSTLYNTSLPLFGQFERKPNSVHGPFKPGLAAGAWRSLFPFYPTYYGAKEAFKPGPHTPKLGNAATLNKGHAAKLLSGHAAVIR